MSQRFQRQVKTYSISISDRDLRHPEAAIRCAAVMAGACRGRTDSNHVTKEALLRALDDPHELVRFVTAVMVWGFVHGRSRAENHHLFSTLRELVLEKGSSPWVRRAAANQLCIISRDFREAAAPMEPAFRAMLESDELDLQRNGIIGLRTIGRLDQSAFDAAVKLAGSPRVRDRRECAETLADFRPLELWTGQLAGAAERVLMRLLDDDNGEVRSAAANSLIDVEAQYDPWRLAGVLLSGPIKTHFEYDLDSTAYRNDASLSRLNVPKLYPFTNELIHRLAREVSQGLSAPAAELLTKIGSSEALQALQDAEATQAEVDSHIQNLLDLVRTKENSVPPALLLRAMISQFERVRYVAIKAVGVTGAKTKDVVKALGSALKDSEDRIAIAAASSLASIGTLSSVRSLAKWVRQRGEWPDNPASSLVGRATGEAVRYISPLLSAPGLGHQTASILVQMNIEPAWDALGLWANGSDRPNDQIAEAVRIVGIGELRSRGVESGQHHEDGSERLAEALLDQGGPEAAEVLTQAVEVWDDSFAWAADDCFGLIAPFNRVLDGLASIANRGPRAGLDMITAPILQRG